VEGGYMLSAGDEDRSEDRMKATNFREHFMEGDTEKREPVGRMMNDA
jgi:hypothetical protein